MNDLNVKIVESPKDQETEGEVLKIAESGDGICENEVDPLALDDADPGSEKSSIVDIISEQSKEKTGSCDENTKEKICDKECVDSEDVAIPSSQPDQKKEESVKESSSECDPLKNNIEELEEVNTIKESLPPEKSAAKNTKPQTSGSNIEDKSIPSPLHIKIKEIEEISVKIEQPKEIKKVDTEPPRPDEEMTDVTSMDNNREQKADSKSSQPTNTSGKSLNGDVTKEEQSSKRCASDEVDTESPHKKLCQDVERTFPQHDTMINDYIQNATKNNVDEIQRHTEQLLSEIQTLRELAQKKEHEWNNILHLKKVKEEILLRLLRRKQVLAFEKSGETTPTDITDPFSYLSQSKYLAVDKSDGISGLAIKQPPPSTVNPIVPSPTMPSPAIPGTSHCNPMSGLPPPYDKATHMQPIPKPVFHQPHSIMLPGPTLPVFPRDMNGQLPTGYGMPMGRQGPTEDVGSIIADYRVKNPDAGPRRGRRLKTLVNTSNMSMNMQRPITPKLDSIANLTNLSNLNMLFNNLDMNQKAMIERLQSMQVGLPNGPSFKDVLVQYANMQNPAMMPSRPPENLTNRPEHVRPEGRRRQERHEEVTVKHAERIASSSPRLPPPPPYPEISLLPVTNQPETSQSQQNSLLHGILTKAPASHCYSPLLAKLLISPEKKMSKPTLPSFGQAKTAAVDLLTNVRETLQNCGEITITPVQPVPPPTEQPQEKTEEVVQLDDEESAASEGSAAGSPGGSGSGGRLVIDESSAAVAGGSGTAAEGGDTPLCQGCRRRDAQFVCAGCANQWYCSRDCQVAAWDEHSEMCSG